MGLEDLGYTTEQAKKIRQYSGGRCTMCGKQLKTNLGLCKMCSIKMGELNKF